MLYEKTVKLFDELEQIKAIAHPEKIEPHGLIQLYLTVTPAIPYLTSLSIRFMREHPKINIDLKVGEDISGLQSGQFDLAISFDDIKHPKWICQKMFSVRRCIFASPDYIKKFGKPKTSEDLLNHNCLINTLYSLQNKWILSEKVVHVSGNFKSNHASVLKQAALDGLGLIWVPPFIKIQIPIL